MVNSEVNINLSGVSMGVHIGFVSYKNFLLEKNVHTKIVLINVDAFHPLLMHMFYSN